MALERPSVMKSLRQRLLDKYQPKDEAKPLPSYFSEYLPAPSKTKTKEDDAIVQAPDLLYPTNYFDMTWEEYDRLNAFDAKANAKWEDEENWFNL